MTKSKGFNTAAIYAVSAIAGPVFSPHAVLLAASRAWLLTETFLGLLVLPFQPKSNLTK